MTKEGTLLNSDPLVYYDIVNEGSDAYGEHEQKVIIARFFKKEDAEEYLRKYEEKGFTYGWSNDKRKIVKREIKEFYLQKV